MSALGVDIDALRASVKEEIDAAAEEALAGPMPDPATAVDGVFCEGEAEPLGDGQAPWSGFARRGRRLMPTLTYLQAISSALRDELRADDRVLLMGEDIGVFGGAFKVTDGLSTSSGPTE